MAEGEDYRTPTLSTGELDNGDIRVVLLIDGLEKKTFSNEPKNAVVHHKFDERSFELTAEVKGSGGKVTKYRQVIKQLPGEIIPSKCDVKYKKNQIILTLHKAQDRSWAAKLASSGLEQDQS